MKKVIILITLLMLLSGCTSSGETQENASSEITSTSTGSEATASETTVTAEEEYSQSQTYNPKDYPDYINILANFDYSEYIGGWSDYLGCSALDMWLLLADVDGDGMAESVLRFNSYHTITCDLVFKVIDGKVQHIGGYSSGKNDMSLKRYKDKDGKIFGITTEEYSLYDGSNLKTLIRVDFVDNTIKNTELCEIDEIVRQKWDEKGIVTDQNGNTLYDEPDMYYYKYDGKNKKEVTKNEYDKYVADYFSECEYLGNTAFSENANTHIGDQQQIAKAIDTSDQQELLEKIETKSHAELIDKFRAAIYDNWYNYESICSYIEARTAALKDNSGISVTLCDEINAFLSGKKRY